MTSAVPVNSTASTSQDWIVLAENDSDDATAAIAAAAASSDLRVTLLSYPGLGVLLPKRTDRLAFCRAEVHSSW